MNYRLATLLDRETATTAATKIIDIDLAEIISGISIQMRGTNNGSTPTAHPAKMISKVELIDGSDVLASLSGIQLQALNINELGRHLYSELNYIDDNVAIVVMDLMFGRKLWDEQLALDPSKFRNLQLKISHNKASGGSAPDAGELSVFAHVFDEKPVAPVGFLVNKEHYTYTLTASAHQYIDLPTDRACRKLIVQSLYTGLQPWQNYNSDLIRAYAQEVNPYFTETIRMSNNTTAFTCYCTPTFDTKMVWAPILGADSGYLGLVSYGGTFTADCTASTEGDLIVSGKCPHGAFCIPLGKQDIIEDWFDARKVGSWKLDITAGGSAVGTVEVITQQLREY
jgi:hypothetical protein